MLEEGKNIRKRVMIGGMKEKDVMLNEDRDGEQISQ
jgi:hypothetical protein